MYFDIDANGKFYIMGLSKSEYQTVRKALKAYANHQGGFVVPKIPEEYSNAKNLLSRLPEVK